MIEPGNIGTNSSGTNLCNNAPNTKHDDHSHEYSEVFIGEENCKDKSLGHVRKNCHEYSEVAPDLHKSEGLKKNVLYDQNKNEPGSDQEGWEENIIYREGSP